MKRGCEKEDLLVGKMRLRALADAHQFHAYRYTQRDLDAQHASNGFASPQAVAESRDSSSSTELCRLTNSTAASAPKVVVPARTMSDRLGFSPGINATIAKTSVSGVPEGLATKAPGSFSHGCTLTIARSFFRGPVVSRWKTNSSVLGRSDNFKFSEGEPTNIRSLLSRRRRQ
jgi:hypothetical protein